MPQPNQFVLHLSPHEGEPFMVGPFPSTDAVHEWIDDHDEGEWDHGTAYVLESPGDESGDLDARLQRLADEAAEGFPPEQIGEPRPGPGAPVIDRKDLMHAVWDGVGNRFDPKMEADDEHWDWYQENVEQPVAALACHVFGHEPVQDHCGMPEHDHCVWCMTLMPGAADRPGS